MKFYRVEGLGHLMLTNILEKIAAYEWRELLKTQGDIVQNVKL